MKHCIILKLLIYSILFFCIISLAQESQKNYIIDITGKEKEIRSDHLKLGGTNSEGTSISVNNYYLSVDNQPVIPITGEFHFSRYPHEYWDEAIKKMKAGGINMIATYVFWNIHEEIEGEFNWEGNRNLRAFIELCAKNNVWAIVRIGPFCHGEIRNGGLPDWLLGRPLTIRSNDPVYLSYVERLYNEIGKQLNGLLFKDGGPVFAIQLENEYQHSASPWGLTYPGQPLDYTSAERDKAVTKEGVGVANGNNPYSALGTEHMKVLKSLAIKAGLTVPIYTATGWGNAAIIENESLPVTAAYAYPTWAPESLSPFYLYTDLQKNPDYAPVRYNGEDYPCFAAEISGGIMDTYSRRPKVPAKSLDALINRFLGSGANGLGYYMYHGGSTPRGGKNFLSDEAYGYPKISYDFQAPIGEFGQINPSFNRLKLMHYFVNAFSDRLAPMQLVLPEDNPTINKENTKNLRYSVRKTGDRGFIFMLNFQDHLQTEDIKNIRFRLKTNKGTLSIPENSTFTLKKNENAIFPFNLDMDGVNLVYATAQLLTKFKNNKDNYFVFFAIDGITPEFLIPNSGELSFEKTNCEIKTAGSKIHARFNEETGQLVIKKANRNNIHILVISREKALNSWLVDIKKDTHLLFCDALIIQNESSLDFISKGNNTIVFDAYPSLKTIPDSSVKILSQPQYNTLFSTYMIKLPEVVYSTDIKKISENKIAITLPDIKSKNVSDILLKIDYIGDTGMGFINGQLVTDHFYFGEPWLIGLKKFIESDGPDEIVFYFRPLYKDAPFYKDFAPELIPNLKATQTMLRIDKIEFVPEYTSTIKLN